MKTLSPSTSPDDARMEYHQRVPADWADYNGHMNLAYYILAFDWASDAFLARHGLDEGYRNGTGCSIFAAEIHAGYAAEVAVGEDLCITTKVLEVGARTLRLFHEMDVVVEGETGSLRRAATNEVLLVHVSLGDRGARPWPDDMKRAFSARALAPKAWPTEAGRHVGQRPGEIGLGQGKTVGTKQPAIPAGTNVEQGGRKE